MKIPNFFHLTPIHIKRHCEALKSNYRIYFSLEDLFFASFFRVNLFFSEFCTPFPKEEHVFEEFPVTIETTDYVYDGPNIRDDRARSVKLEVKHNRATERHLAISFD